MLSVRAMRRILFSGEFISCGLYQRDMVTSSLLRSGFKQNAEASFTKIFRLELLLEGVASKTQDLTESYLSSIEYQLL